MQIRDAVGRPLLLEPRWLDPLLDVCVRALPVAYRDTPAPVGTVIRLEVEAGRPRAFRLVRDASGWSIGDADNESAACTIRLSSDAAWRLLFNALDPAAAEAAVQVFGDAALARPLLSARAVIV